MRHLIDPMDLSVEDIDRLLDRADDIAKNPEKYQEVCKHKKLATLFFEPSTRTRLSFEAAMLELGGSVLGFSSADSSSASKGESVADTARVIECYADIIAMRHPKEGAPYVASQYVNIPVINAGDGGHNHPTQTLTDLLTIRREKGRLSNFTIGFCGDLKFGRTVHSLIKALSRYEGINYILISPEELQIPEYLKKDVFEKKGITFTEVDKMEDVMPQLDILYMTRVQRERFFNEADYVRLKDSYILDMDKLKIAKKDLSILHPLPRVNEISVKVDNDPRACYFKQVLNGKHVRMALIMELLGFQQAADDGSAEAGVVHIGVTAHHHKVQLVPAACFHVCPADGQKFGVDLWGRVVHNAPFVDSIPSQSTPYGVASSPEGGASFVFRSVSLL